MARLQTEQAELEMRLERATEERPDTLPTLASLYRCKVDRLAAALQHLEERAAATQAIRDIFGKITLTPSQERGKIDVALHGDLGTILDWAAEKRHDLAETCPRNRRQQQGLFEVTHEKPGYSMRVLKLAGSTKMVVRDRCLNERVEPTLTNPATNPKAAYSSCRVAQIGLTVPRFAEESCEKVEKVRNL